MLSQLFANALIAGSFYALVAVSFALIYRVVGFFHFTHGLTFALGAYFTYGLVAVLDIPLIPAAIAGVFLTGVFGLLMGATLFRILRTRNASPLVALLASLGLYVVGQNVLSLLFGDVAHSLRQGRITVGWAVGSARITSLQVAIIGVSVAILIGIGLAMSCTKLGRQVRAVADDLTLAQVVGVPVKTIGYIVMALGASISGAAGVLFAFDQDMTPTMGMHALLIGVVAMIVGGQRSVLGVSLAAWALALAQNLALLVAPAAWQDMVVFVVLVAFLVLSPRSFLRTPHRPRAAA